MELKNQGRKVLSVQELIDVLNNVENKRLPILAVMPFRSKKTGNKEGRFISMTGIRPLEKSETDNTPIAIRIELVESYKDKNITI